MPTSELDHIVVTAPNLKVGVEWVRDVLGAIAELGGEHSSMGTHNCLLKLGDAVYLEVIAPNPNANKPEQPRWFELDHLQRNSPPRLAAWVARTPDIHSAHAACGDLLGSIEPMSRGDLNWSIAFPEDGRLPLAGIAPMLIEWPLNIHPVTRMRDTGCSLLLLEGFHPDPPKISAVLESIGFEGEMRVRELGDGARPYLVAHIRTRDGVKRLGGA